MRDNDGTLSQSRILKYAAICLAIYGGYFMIHDRPLESVAFFTAIALGQAPLSAWAGKICPEEKSDGDNKPVE